ncbi:UTP--glucose-1-phosphate uridylyltransferase [Pseudoclavibacter sp. RFBA6]|uniref:UTP--glucose-1-phosphate uridylyltransferase n=1 Tax=Pseudoclavibacter sp. RFBA6 TaxID=2080573 RepID=UPI000CE8947F|nr:UTP--glucose-1-phosphate uridylyltransferase [Pseudoclavibacter sp. RFBA6]PPG39688.1 UTP--glucose-1-phosphate uridylyltransferase [Pseudoclavibacter sp. RFBA6]
MSSRITKAVIPAAGLGTRFLPATKAIPKEMLPVVDRPAIQYVVEEAVDAGLTDVLMITGRNKTTLENHFDRVAEIEALLEARGETEKLARVRAATNLADVHYLRQGDPLGLGHAVLRARQHVGDEAFAVLLGDDIMAGGGSLLTRMVRVHEATGASVVALQEVDPAMISSYGVVAYDAASSVAEGVPGAGPDTIQITGLVEKPSLEDAPSNFAVIGRYLLRPEVFAVLEQTKPGAGGEIQLTDALQVLAANREELGGVVGVVYRERRFDTGNKLDYIKAIVELAIDDPKLGPALSPWLQQFARSLAE